MVEMTAGAACGNESVRSASRVAADPVYAIWYTSRMTKTIPVREFRSNLAEVLSDVADRRDHVVVTDEHRRVLAVRPAFPEEGVVRALHGGNVLGTPSAVLVSTSAVQAVGGFDERLSVTADWDLWLRILTHGSLIRAGGLTVGYTHHTANMHLSVERTLVELELVRERHGHRAAELGVTPAQVGLAWQLAHYDRTLLIPGTANPAHLAENLAAGDIKLPEASRTALDHLAAATPGGE